jgi:hypothetical protein
MNVFDAGETFVKNVRELIFTISSPEYSFKEPFFKLPEKTEFPKDEAIEQQDQIIERQNQYPI